jgi:hypothetical protein
MKYFRTDSAYRIDQSKAKLPKIPVQPIGYDEAEVFLKYELVHTTSPILNQFVLLQSNVAEK